MNLLIFGRNWRMFVTLLGRQPTWNEARNFALQGKTGLVGSPHTVNHY